MRACLLLLIVALARCCGALDPYKTSLGRDPRYRECPDIWLIDAQLGVARSANSAAIKKAYRKLSKQFHPDKNPNDPAAHDKFVAVSQAYEILSDDEKRQIFDRHGEEGLKRHQSGQSAAQHDPFDMFRQFFGGGGGQQHGQARGPNMVSEVRVPLKDIYVGRTFDISISRKAICDACDGSGARDPSDVVHCQTCNGQGVRLVRHQIAPGFFTQAQATCDQCRGQGKMVKHRCPRCQGARIVQTTSNLSLNIDRGLPEGAEVVFEGEADESPDYVAGDVVVHVHTDYEQGGFSRVDSHLYWTEPISVREALLGFERQIRHLDGHLLTLRRSEVTQPGFVQTFHEEGMPHHGSLGHGDLFVTYEVVLPAQIDASMRTKLEAAFGPPKKRSKGEL